MSGVVKAVKSVVSVAAPVVGAVFGLGPVGAAIGGAVAGAASGGGVTGALKGAVGGYVGSSLAGAAGATGVVTSAAGQGAIVGGSTGLFTGGVKGAVTGAVGGALTGYGMGLYGPSTAAGAAVNSEVASAAGHVNVPGAVAANSSSSLIGNMFSGVSWKDAATALAMSGGGGGQPQVDVVLPNIATPPTIAPTNTASPGPVAPDLTYQAIEALGKKRGRASTILAGGDGTSLGGALNRKTLMGA